MTERALGTPFKWFTAKVVNRGDGKEGEKDKTESGRVQIRVYGKHDDTKNIPDKELPWAVPLLPVGTGASKEGVGASPVGLKKGSTVVGFYFDKDETIPVIFGVLHKAGTDSGDDGTDVETKKNDTPKGSRSSETGGGDQNDVLKKRMTEEVGKEGQHHKDKPTIGDVPFQGEGVLDSIKKIDPSNVSGSIPGALNGMKSMVNTLAVAGTLLANFKALTSGKLSITGLLAAATNVTGATAQLTGQLAGVGGTVGQVAGAVSAIASTANQVAAMTYVQSFGGVPVNMVVNGNQGVTAKFGDVVININNQTDRFGNVISTSGTVIRGGIIIGTGNMAQIGIVINGISPQAQKILAGVQAVSIASNLVANAFGGQNPLETLLNGLGGLTGITSLASKAAGLLGPLTQNFAAATAVANNLRNQTQMAFAGLQPAPFRTAVPGQTAKVLQNIGNIAGIVNNIATGGAGIYAGNIPIIPAAAAALGNVLNIPPSLINSAIQIPLTSLAVVNTLRATNPGMSIGFGATAATLAAASILGARNPGFTFQPGFVPILPVTPPTRITYANPVIIRDVNYVSPTASINLGNSLLSVNIPILDTRVINTVRTVPGIGFNVSGIGLRF